MCHTSVPIHSLLVAQLAHGARNRRDQDGDQDHALTRAPTLLSEHGHARDATPAKISDASPSSNPFCYASYLQSSDQFCQSESRP